MEIFRGVRLYFTFDNSANPNLSRSGGNVIYHESLGHDKVFSVLRYD